MYIRSSVRLFIFSTLLPLVAAVTNSCASKPPDGPQELVTASAAALVTSGHPGRLRVLSFNTHLVSEIFYGVASAVLDINGNNSYFEATRIGNAILSEDFDVLVLTEVFDEGARDRLIELLAPQYPFYAGQLEHDLPDVEEDAGIIIFSRFQFVDVPGEHNEGELVHFNNITIGDWRQHVGTHIYNDCFGIDCMAAKGFLHVRVAAPSGTYDIIGTHMQSDIPTEPIAAEVVRVHQLGELHDYLVSNLSSRLDNAARGPVIVAGDLNIDGSISAFPDATSLETPSTMLIESEYGLTLWRGFDGSMLYDAWRTTADRDRGATIVTDGEQRLDYFLINGGGFFANGGSPRQTSAMNGRIMYPQWVRTTMRDVGSDHDAVALEIGPGSTFGAAWNAEPVTLSLFSKVISFDQDGSNHWFKLPLSGTYSIGLPQAATDAGVVFDVFPEDDLGRRLGPSRLFEDTFDVDFKYRTYSTGSKPAYVRVYAPLGDVTGNAPIVIKRHDCATRSTACVLKPGAPPLDVNVEGNPLLTEGWFRLQTSPTSAGPHNVELDVTTPAEVTLQHHLGGPSNPGASETFDFTSMFFVALPVPANDFAELLVRPMVSGAEYRIWWTTDVTLLRSRDNRSYLISAYVAGETGVDFGGSDEVGLEAFADSLSFATTYNDDVDTSETVSFQLAPVGFRTSLDLHAKEYVNANGGDVDNHGSLSIPALDRSIEELLGQKSRLQADGLKLDFSYTLTHSEEP